MLPEPRSYAGRPSALSIVEPPAAAVTFARPSGTIAAGATTDTGRSNSGRGRRASPSRSMSSLAEPDAARRRPGSSLPRAEPFTFSVPLMPSARPRIGLSPTPRNVQRRPLKLEAQPAAAPGERDLAEGRVEAAAALEGRAHVAAAEAGPARLAAGRRRAGRGAASSPSSRPAPPAPPRARRRRSRARASWPSPPSSRRAWGRRGLLLVVAAARGKQAGHREAGRARTAPSRL